MARATGRMGAPFFITDILFINEHLLKTCSGPEPVLGTQRHPLGMSQASGLPHPSPNPSAQPPIPAHSSALDLPSQPQLLCPGPLPVPPIPDLAPLSTSGFVTVW